MQRIEYRDRYDKSGWGDGPWLTEPDKIQWRDEATGLPCLIVRNDMGGLCGYVGVGPENKFYGVEYTEVDDVAVHGGLTFSGLCDVGENEEQRCVTICHTVEKGESDDVWWLGFDCGHCYDKLPGLAKYPGMRERPMDVYRDVAYVTEQIENLAKQLAAST